MSNPAPTDQAVTISEPQEPVRRSRKRWQLAMGLVALVTLAVASTGCLSSSMQAKEAILKYWGTKNAPCAERIAQRESGMDPTAVNPSSGTVGLFQIHPTHATWIKNKYGYTMSQLTDPYKNAEVAAGLSAEAYRYYGDGWQPWRIGGVISKSGGCPA